MVDKTRHAKGTKQEAEMLPQIILRRTYKTICVFIDSSLTERQQVKIRDQANLLGNDFRAFNTL